MFTLESDLIGDATYGKPSNEKQEAESTQGFLSLAEGIDNIPASEGQLEFSL